jgi:exodeoxyribonuclease VII large subunit
MAMTIPDEPADTQTRPLTVFEITRNIDQKITGQPGLSNVYVKGELIDFKVQPGSGHAYFTLTDKDSDTAATKKAILKCTFFRYTSQNMTFTPKPGMEVLVSGSISLYYQGGQYNFNSREIIELGLGRLMIKIQELKQKLIREGVINPANRKPLPEIPRKLGIVTGLGTAALKDILKQVKDRYPNIDIVISPALVQGEDAPSSIVNALNEISRPKWGCDVIIVGRGGGSAEDLMAFNNEAVCRAIHTCPVPVISAVGHQIDHPVSDDVADVAAATPTDGAKIALPVITEKLESLEMLDRHMHNLLKNLFNISREKLRRIAEKPFYNNPQLLIMEYYRMLDDKEARLQNSLLRLVDKIKTRITSLPDIANIMEKTLMRYRHDFIRVYEVLTAYSPLATLKRGYAVVYKDNRIIKNAAGIDVNDEISIRMHDGNVTATVRARHVLPLL